MTASAKTIDVPVSGGSLHASIFGQAGATVLALHGITATGMAWLEVANQLPGVTLLAPDLRGRGRSAELPGPYGFSAHVADLVSLLDGTGNGRVAVVGHSMGGFVALELAARHPERVSRLVLVDGGLPTGRPEDPVPPGGIDAVLGPAAERLRMTFASREAYRAYWREHPALGPIWGPVVEAYVDYDLIGEPPDLRSSCREDAMRVDGSAVADHATVEETLRRVTAPISFLRAERGMLNAPPAFYPEQLVTRWEQEMPSINVSTVPDTNHYSVVMAAPGAASVARAVAEATIAGADPGREDQDDRAYYS
jgi:pimeloyl-ACP methyl ester carboxylesterase